MTAIDWRTDLLLEEAKRALNSPVRAIADVTTPLSAGGPNDYYSPGTYWWPDPDKPDGLPFIRRDGFVYVDGFWDHSRIMGSMRDVVSSLAIGYKLTDDAVFANRAAEHLHAFFIDKKRRMNPNMLYAQAIPGVCTGRGIGIIDALHLVDVPMAVRSMENALSAELVDGLRAWFREFLTWISTHEYGISERKNGNNHTITWYVQAAAYAAFVGDETMLNECAEAANNEIISKQMADDGSFPKELARTKPYGYSIFTLDNLCTLYQLLPRRVSWQHTLPDGRSLSKAIAYLLPYLENKANWPYPPDVEAFEHLPARASFMLFAGIALGNERLIRLYNSLPVDTADAEVRRNLGVRAPYLWLN